jgi:hypothetical protein
MAASNSSKEDHAMSSGSSGSATNTGGEHEEGPGKREGDERPELVVPTLPDGSIQEGGAGEIQPAPVKPELAPVPEQLKN